MMKKLFPTVLQQQHSTHSCSLLLDITADLHYFEGHFPAAPVLAGVAQMDWAVQFSQQLLFGNRPVMAVEMLKFQQMVQPGCQLTLILEQSKPDTSTFTYTCGERTVASGRFKWGPAHV